MNTTKKMAQAKAYAEKKVTTSGIVTRQAAAVKRALRRNLWVIVFAALVAAVVGLLAVPAAYQERQYWAIGGEWLLIVLTFVGVLWFGWEE